MIRSLAKVSILAGVLCLFLKPESAYSQSGSSFKFFYELNFESCRQELPAPTLLAEPRFTQGTRNVIGIQVPPLSSIPFSPDTIRSPIIITLVNDGPGAAVLKFPRPVQLGEDVIETETVSVLRRGVRYSYTAALFLPVCKIPCSAVTDTSQLELYCSAYEDTVWSTQDAAPPIVSAVSIPQSDLSPAAGWWNQSTIEVRSQVSDPAGVWQAFLYRRNCGQSGWGAAVSDTTFTGVRNDTTGFEFGESAAAVFSQTLADGCYEFRIEGKDATHTPESFFPNFELAGNGGQPAAEASPHIRINIDTTPPQSVLVTARQVFNTIELRWTASTDPAPGIGLAGYNIFRNSERIATVGNSTAVYFDSLSAETPTAIVSYQIQPFDSLGNLQTAGGTVAIDFIGVTKVAMIPEPEFTAGRENQVCWRGSPIVDSYSVYYAENCNFEQKVKFDISDTCFTFTDLKDGAAYCYWVEAVDRQQRSVISDTVRSTQDASLPELTSLEIPERVTVNRRNWVNRRDVQIQLSAADSPPGQIHSLKIFENNQLTLTFIPPAPSSQIDVVAPITLVSSQCEDSELYAVVEDGAGNRGLSSRVTVRWDATPPPPVPNLSARQLAITNGVRLEWSAVQDDVGCSGLAGYHILRNGEQIAAAPPDSSGFSDFFTADTPSGQFTYQVQPFDSLQNRQSDSPLATVDYLAAPQIVVESLPEFTPGTTNEICWEVVGALVDLKLFVDQACDAVVDDGFDILNPAASQCQTVAALIDGQRYCYWLEGVDEQQRTVRSAVVFSTQDDTPPVIDDFAFPEGDVLNGQIWAFERDIHLQFVAHDAPPGEIWRGEILENNLSPSDFSNPDSSTNLNQRVPYAIQSQGIQPVQIDLQARVFDGAGNPSAPVSLTIFFQEDLPSIYAYPNPFNPMKGEITIRLRDDSESEMKIYDFFGNLVQTLTTKVNHRDFSWDGLNGEGEMVANGGYICVGTKTGARFKIGVVKQK